MRIYGTNKGARTLCVDATKIRAPNSDYLYQIGIKHYLRNFFGINSFFSDLKNIRTGEVHASRNMVIFRGSWLYLAVNSIYIDARSNEHCHGVNFDADYIAPDKRYLEPKNELPMLNFDTKRIPHKLAN